MRTKQPETLAQECADYATSLRSAANVVKLEGRKPPVSFMRAADLFERAATYIAAQVEALSAAQAELAAMRAGGEPVAEMVPYHTPSGKRVAVISRFQHLPIGTKLYTHPQPAAQDAERIQALELEVRQLTEQIAELRGGAAYSLPEWLEVMHASEIRGIWNDCKRDGLHYVAFAWRIERLGWQRLLDALRSSRGKAPAQQPAPSAAPAGTYMTPEQVRDGIADWIDENILHREFWTPEVVDLVRSIEINPAAISPKPVPTPQADSQPAQVLVYPPLPEPFIGVQNQPWGGHAEVIRSAIGEDGVIPCFTAGQMVAYADATHAARAPADSVLEDAK